MSANSLKVISDPVFVKEISGDFCTGHISIKKPCICLLIEITASAMIQFLGEKSGALSSAWQAMITQDLFYEVLTDIRIIQALSFLKRHQRETAGDLMREETNGKYF